MATQVSPNRTGPWLLAALLLWAGAIALAAVMGWLAAMPNPGVPLIAVGGVAALTLAYANSGAARTWAAHVGLRRLTLFHAWRIGAALLFFAFGARGELPPVLVRDGGIGDLTAGALALFAALTPFARWRYWLAHLFGAADLVVALATGVALSIADPAAMAAVRHLPFALIPMFGVAVTFAAHLVAFDLLRRGEWANA